MCECGNPCLSATLYRYVHRFRLHMSLRLDKCPPVPGIYSNHMAQTEGAVLEEQCCPKLNALVNSTLVSSMGLVLRGKN